MSKFLAGHDGDIDPPLVVAVDQHHVAIQPAQQLVVEPHQRRPVVGFDDADDVRIDVLDDPGGHAGAGLVDGLLGELDPADPTPAPGGDDLDVF